MRGRRSTPDRAPSRPLERARWIWGVAWLPLLLGGLAMVLEPMIDGFLLGLVLLAVALATTWVRDIARHGRRRPPDV